MWFLAPLFFPQKMGRGGGARHPCPPPPPGSAPDMHDTLRFIETFRKHAADKKTNEYLVILMYIVSRMHVTYVISRCPYHSDHFPTIIPLPHKVCTSHVFPQFNKPQHMIVSNFPSTSPYVSHFFLINSASLKYARVWFYQSI